MITQFAVDILISSHQNACKTWDHSIKSIDLKWAQLKHQKANTIGSFFFIWLNMRKLREKNTRKKHFLKLAHFEFASGRGERSITRTSLLFTAHQLRCEFFQPFVFNAIRWKKETCWAGKRVIPNSIFNFR